MSATRDAVLEILNGLDAVEQGLLSKVLTLEHEKLYQKNPQLKTDILKIVRDTVK